MFKYKMMQTEQHLFHVYDDNLDPECQIIPQICTFLSVPFSFLYKSLVAFNDYSGFSVFEVLL